MASALAGPPDHLTASLNGGSPSLGQMRAMPSGSARSQLLTVLGELVGPSGVPAWTSTILHVLTGLGLEEQTARQAIARGAGAGWMEGEKRGREVRWTLTAAGRELTDEIIHRAESLSHLGPAWDGNCLILFITIPQQQKAVRKRLYSALSWAGFGNPMPGLWASPHVDRAEEITAVISELGLQDSTIGFVGGTFPAGLSDPEIVRRAWDLDGVAARYETLLETFGDLEPADGDELLFAYVSLVHEWHQFPLVDPQLPEDLLPNWVGRRGIDLFADRRREWSGRAFARWRELNDPAR
ncbi:PaaX family transcriptional regulator [Pseudonocardia sp. Cha107L01]|uniref:PaaX family transcriptional regulator n=1 Tax=Pseudonocardia sp. Cha107L01 TaxID=3457576 RepID=UPI00403E5733